EPLPIVLDDVLVTSDATRIRAALEALVQLGMRTQVIVLTHSPLVRDIALDLAAPGTCSVVELEALVTAG
ncbi:MAG: hypothetical protein JWN41_1612, partial [Thermoleophilia bacterium]|nr:hypothetical protein [Thermoleophilia bacterium]